MPKQQRTLLQTTGDYITDYLPVFMAGNNERDIRFFGPGGYELSEAQARQPHTEACALDLHEKRFRELYDSLPRATLRDFRDAVSNIDNVVVIELCSWYGEMFGLWVAANNPSAEVHVYDPETRRFNFSPMLFNDKHPDRIWKFEKRTGFTALNVEDSVNNLYIKNGLKNIHFHQEAADAVVLENYALSFSGRPVVFVGLRVNELVPEICRVVRKYRNAGVVMTPFLSSEYGHSDNDPVIEEINRGIEIRAGQERDRIIDPAVTGRSRLFTVMQQYVSLKAARQCGERARVYRESIFELGSPFHQPTHYVSTVNMD
jgi:hypothetical protein